MKIVWLYIAIPVLKLCHLPRWSPFFGHPVQQTTQKICREGDFLEDGLLLKLQFTFDTGLCRII